MIIPKIERDQHSRLNRACHLMAPNRTTHIGYSSEVAQRQQESKSLDHQSFAGISQQSVSSRRAPSSATMSSRMSSECASSPALSYRPASQSSSGVTSSRLHRRPSSSLSATWTSTSSTPSPSSSLSLMSSTLITISRHTSHLCQILERLRSVRTTAAFATSTAMTSVAASTPTHSPTPASTSLRTSTQTKKATRLAATTKQTATFIKSISLEDAVNEPVNHQPLMSEEQQKQNLISCCSCQTQLPSENTDSGYHQAECRLSPDESLEVRPLSNRTCKNSGSSNNSITIANKGSISRTMSTRHRRHHNHRYDNPQRPTPWTSTFAGSCSWWSRLVSSSSTSMTSSATSSFFVTLLLLLFSTMLHTADSCSSRSTPKPRPPTPTTRPNITFQTYACPEAYAKWYCLNGATCFSVRIGESILYNCECSDGYMGQRCEFKDLDGSYLPSREKILVETAGIAGGVTLAVILVVVLTIYYYTYVRNQRRAQEQYAAPLLDDDHCSPSYRDQLGHGNGVFDNDNCNCKSNSISGRYQRNSNLMQHYQHQSFSKCSKTDQLTLLSSSLGKQYGTYGTIASRTQAEPSVPPHLPPSSSSCIVCLNSGSITNLHHPVPTSQSSHVMDLESGCRRPVSTTNIFSC